jgi:hypothetical protein
MYSFPITIPFRGDEGVYPLDVSVFVDDIVRVTPIDIDHSIGVESNTLYSCLPSCELLLADGRKLPILETAATIHRYLEAYRQIETFYTAPATPASEVSSIGIRNQPVRCVKPNEPRVRPLTGLTEGVVVPLFGRTSCDTSEAPTPA